MSLITIIRIISFRELFNEYNFRFVPYGVYFTFTQTKYLLISLLAKINREVNYSSLTNQNVEETN